MIKAILVFIGIALTWSLLCAVLTIPTGVAFFGGMLVGCLVSIPFCNVIIDRMYKK